MKFGKTQVAVVAVVMSVLALPTIASADPIIAISSDALASSFVLADGAYGLGAFDIEDNADIIVKYLSGSTTVYANGSVFLGTDLFQDISAGGVAHGIFKGGVIRLDANDGSNLLMATIDQIEVAELPSVPDTLVGTGFFTVTGGTLAGDFGGSGQVFQLTFDLDPSGIEDFSSGGGAGVSDLKLTPIREPASLMLVGTAGLSLLGWIRRRRMV